jgi:hypothetical protein
LDALKEIFPKLTRWDAVSILILLIMAWTAIQGFKVVSPNFSQLIQLLAFLFAGAYVTLVVEAGLKRLEERR